MKKEKRLELIRKKSEQYAKSGGHIDYQTIEWKLKSEGFPEARQELDDKYIRSYLNDLCDKANSDEERTRKKHFAEWLGKTISESESLIKEKLNGVRIRAEKNMVSIIGETVTLEIERMFFSKKFDVSSNFRNPSGLLFSHSVGNLENINFDECDSITFVEAVAECFLNQVNNARWY